MADNHTIYKNGAKEIAALAGRALTFMAKYDIDEVGSSCHVHSSLWDAAAGPFADAPTTTVTTCRDTFRWYLGGLLATAAEFALAGRRSSTRYKRYQPGSWAPTAIGWGIDNRTLGLRVVGHGQGMRVESRIPGADCNPYLALAATIAGGLYGIEHRIDPGDAFVGQRLRPPTCPASPTRSSTPSARSRTPRSPRTAFGDDVHFHLLHMARQEWDEFNRHVTDWELRRNFERL